MKLKTLKYYTIGAVLAAGALTSCESDPNSPGVEYMPDMYRSPAVEAYVDYAEVRGLFRPELLTGEVSMVPPVGTIPYYGTGENVSYMMPYSHGAPIGADKSHGLFDIKQDTLGRDGAKGDINPIAYSDEVLKEGKRLFGNMCIHCHGEAGDGQGSVVLNSLDKFPSPGPFGADLTPGEIFYTITYGKGAMGSHASQLNKEERWKVVWYVQKLKGDDVENFSANDSTVVEIPVIVEVEEEHNEPTH